MDFSLNQEQEMFRGYVKKYLDNAGQTKMARDSIKGNEDTVQQAMSGLSELGCMAITISEQYDGLGLGSLDLVPVLEEMGRALLPGIYAETMAFAVPLLEKYGTDAQKERYLPEIASGNKTMTVAWMEPNMGYVTQGMETKARVEGESYILDGTKTLVPNGASADYILVLSTTQIGHTFFIVHQEQLEDIQKQEAFDESLQLSQITFHHIKVPKEQVLGEAGKADILLEEGLLHMNAALCSLMVGSMEKIVSMAAEYAKIREQFGQPIGRFQAIKHRIVDMKMELETARSLSYYANWALDTHAEDRAAAIYSARAYTTEAFIAASAANVQIHGGIGFTEELDCHLFVKRARYYEGYLGTVQQNREKAALALNW
ncbi:acyl-CoA dehydrogenase family protein [Bacillus sp. 1P06AnD]|uniref:acyl-CoA dehydrogenase family protein n=1 Tax=Bacillus sp. 1P06AnD TaxID=3132208 RepID=UPI0039A2A5A7